MAFGDPLPDDAPAIFSFWHHVTRGTNYEVQGYVMMFDNGPNDGEWYVVYAPCAIAGEGVADPNGNGPIDPREGVVSGARPIAQWNDGRFQPGHIVGNDADHNTK